MAEDFNDYGSYREYLENEEFKSRSLIRKIFSWRAVKFAVKSLGVLIVVAVFAVLFWRIFSSKNPEKAADMIWTNASYGAYQEYGNDLLIYSQDLNKVFSKDGKFSVYELRYIPSAKELQFTIRYNKSTVDTLAYELSEKSEAGETIDVDALPEMPFVFALRDDKGDVYTESEYVTFTKGRYTYVRIAFSDVELFDIEKNSPEPYFPVPGAENSDYIYKGRFESVYTVEAIKKIYLDSYYVGDEEKASSFSETITVYSSDKRTSVYDHSDERPKGITGDITAASAAKED